MASEDARPAPPAAVQPPWAGRVLSAAQAQQFDEKATSQFGVPGLLLMENAARGMVESLLRRGAVGPFAILCGGGNNGGDGLAIARQLDGLGCAVRVVLFADADRLRGDARANYEMARLARLTLVEAPDAPLPPVVEEWLAECEWVVDALLGVGSRGVPREPIAGAIRAANRSGKPILSVDLPSGLDADAGPPAPNADEGGSEEGGSDRRGEPLVVRAKVTAACGSLKPGLVHPAAGPFTGVLEVIPLGAPARLWESFRPE